MSNPSKTKTAPAPAPDLTAAAEALRASVDEQAAAMSAAVQREQQLAAAAYDLLLQDRAAGRDPQGWSHYLEAAQKASEPTTKN
jgi:hypothetical protein